MGNTTKELDLIHWHAYKKNPNVKKHRDSLLKRMEPLIHQKINLWKGPVPFSVLKNEAKVLALKAFDTFDPNKGVALSTHVVNNLAPLSRVVYTHQNTARLPENITLKIRAYTQAKDHLTTMLGREPTSDEMFQELGWTVAELNRVERSEVKDLIESAGNVNANFYSSSDYSEDDLLASIYFELTPEEKKLYEDITGYNGKRKLTNTEIMKKYKLTQAQFSYKKNNLKKKIDTFMQGRR